MYMCSSCMYCECVHCTFIFCTWLYNVYRLPQKFVFLNLRFSPFYFYEYFRQLRENHTLKWQIKHITSLSWFPNDIATERHRDNVAIWISFYRDIVRLPNDFVTNFMEYCKCWSNFNDVYNMKVFWLEFWFFQFLYLISNFVNSVFFKILY